MATTRNPFSEKDDVHLVKFLAKHKPEPRGRMGNAIYQQLVENAGNKWPWAESHSWQSWRERYKKHQDMFDRKIKLLQKRQGQAEGAGSDVQEGSSIRTQNPEPTQTPRKYAPFTDSDDEHLAEFLATRDSDMGRSGNNLYLALQAEAEELPWVKRHPWQSWKERYKKNQEKIGALIANYEGRKRVKKEKAAAAPVGETSRARSSVQPPQASTSKSIGKERQKDAPVAAIPSKITSKLDQDGNKEQTNMFPPPKAPQASSLRSKGKEREIPAYIPARPTAPQASTSHPNGKEKQKDHESQPDRSTHVEMWQERTTGPGKNQRVQSATPAPVAKAPPPPSLNRKGKQKENPPHIEQTPTSASRRDISIPPIVIKSQSESDEDIDMHSLFGSDDDEVDELEDSQSQNISKVPPRAKPAGSPPPPKKDLPPERILVPSSSQVAPVPSSPAKPPSPQVQQPLRKKAPAAKPRLSKKDENIFVSSDAEPSTPSPRHAKSSPRKPYAEAPKIVEGPYRSHLKRVRPRVESDSDEAPPKRARRNPESDSSNEKAEKVQVDERVSQKQTKENINPVATIVSTGKKSATQVHARKSTSQGAPVARAPAPTHVPKVPIPQSVATPYTAEPRPAVPRAEPQENAFASSSRVRLSDIPAPRMATPVAPTVTPASAGRIQPPAPKPIAAPLSSPKDAVSRSLPPQPRNVIETVHWASSLRRDSGVIISPGYGSEADFFNAPLYIPSSGNNKGKEREYVLDVRPPRIDLRRETLSRRRSQIHSVSQITRTDSLASSSSSSNLTTSERRSRRESAAVERRPPRMSVASEDALSALLEWMPPLMDMAAEYDVADAVAVKLFKRLMSMEKTEVVLFALSCDLTEEDGLKAYHKKKTVARAKEALVVFAQSKKIFEEDVSSGSGEEEMPSGLVLRSQVPSASASAVRVVKRESGASAQAQAPSTKRRRSRPSLIIRRIPPNEDDAISDYIPPKNSRAGQYARLQKQGRVAEAKEREQNRVLITETQTQYVPLRMHSPSVSPSPHARLQGHGMSRAMMDVDTTRVDGHHQEERSHETGQEENDKPEQNEDSFEDIFVDAEEGNQRDDVVMAEGSEDEDLDTQGGGGGLHAGDDDEEQGEEDQAHGDVEQPSDAEEEEEEDQPEVEAVAEEDQEEQAGEDEDDDDVEDGTEEERDEEDNGIFGSRESEDEPEEQYFEERGTSPTNSDLDPDENLGPSSPPPNENLAEDHPSGSVVEENDFAQNTGTVDGDDDDIYMAESLEMPYPGQPQRHEESQEVVEAELEAEGPPQSSGSDMQPSSLPSLLTFGSGGPDKNPAFADIAKTHRQLAFNATAENDQELRNFEEKHGDKSDLMRLWSIKWAKVLMQHNPTDNE